MLFYIIKNNFKLMLRNKWTICLLLFGPAIVVAALMNAFGGLMNTDYTLAPYTVGICINSNGPYAKYEKTLTDIYREVLSENEGTLIIYDNISEEEGGRLVSDGEITDFIYIDTSYSIIQSEDYAIAGHVVAYCSYMVMSGFDKAMSTAVEAAAGAVIPSAAITEAASASIDRLIVEEGRKGMTLPSAGDYYGIAQITYFLCCGMICLSSVILSENKNNLRRKYIISPASNTKLFLGKWIPAVLIDSVTILFSIILTIFLFDIKWGNPPMSALILFLTIMATMAFGILIFQLINNVAIAVIIQMSITWVAGFLGGSFETYIFTSTPEFIQHLSPLYYTNRTLIEYATDGQSSYTIDCIVFMLVMTLISSLLTILLMKKKLEVK